VKTSTQVTHPCRTYTVYSIFTSNGTEWPVFVLMCR